MKVLTSPPKVLYHYTSLNAVKGIMQSDAVYFRCTHYGYLNDPEEMHIGNCFINKLLNQANIPHPLKLADTYILSLSKNKDYTQMWKRYGENGQGVMLEVNTSSLLKVCQNVEPCLYCDKDGVLIGSNKTERIARIVGNLKDSYYSNPPKVMTALTSHILLGRISGAIKSSDFEIENEVRAIFEPGKLEVSYYHRNNISVPYITISLPKDAIRNVWIGPDFDKVSTKANLDDFFKSRGYNLDIEVSKIDSINDCDE
jgi:hypothetical protein